MEVERLRRWSSRSWAGMARAGADHLHTALHAHMAHRWPAVAARQADDAHDATGS
jgi:hypothetical protein